VISQAFGQSAIILAGLLLPSDRSDSVPVAVPVTTET
jgi:hypothetical protein